MKILVAILLPILAGQMAHMPIGHLTDVDGKTIVITSDPTITHEKAFLRLLDGGLQPIDEVTDAGMVVDAGTAYKTTSKLDCKLTSIKPRVYQCAPSFMFGNHFPMGKTALVAQNDLVDAGIDAGTPEMPEDAGTIVANTSFCDLTKGICEVKYAIRDSETSDAGVVLPDGWWISRDKMKSLGVTVTNLQNDVKDKDYQISKLQSNSGIGSQLRAFIWGFSIGIGIVGGAGVYYLVRKK